MAEASIYYVSRTFEKESLPLKGTRETQFDDCVFSHCDLTEADFRGCNFTNCTFDNCNLSMVKFVQVGVDNLQFIRCKMVGADLSHAKDFLFGANFDACILDYMAFMKKKNRKSNFRNCSLKGADFSEADLTGANFDRCDLTGAVFMRTTLNEANFVTSYNFIIDPEQNQLRKARFASHALAGLLANYGIIVE